MPEINDENVESTDNNAEDKEETDTESENSKEVETLKEELGNLKRDHKKLLKETEKKENVEVTESSDKSDELNEGQIALLSVKGYSDSADIAYIQGEMKDSGKSLTEVVEMKYVKEALEDLKKARETQDAGDVTSKRSHSSARDTVEYHVAKKTPLYDISDVELRRKVVKSKIDAEKNVSKFATNPVIRG